MVRSNTSLIDIDKNIIDDFQVEAPYLSKNNDDKLKLVATLLRPYCLPHSEVLKSNATISDKSRDCVLGALAELTFNYLENPVNDLLKKERSDIFQQIFLSYNPITSTKVIDLTPIPRQISNFFPQNSDKFNRNLQAGFMPNKHSRYKKLNEKETFENIKFLKDALKNKPERISNIIEAADLPRIFSLKELLYYTNRKSTEINLDILHQLIYVSSEKITTNLNESTCICDIITEANVIICKNWSFCNNNSFLLISKILLEALTNLYDLGYTSLQVALLIQALRRSLLSISTNCETVQKFLEAIKTNLESICEKRIGCIEKIFTHEEVLQFCEYYTNALRESWFSLVDILYPSIYRDSFKSSWLPWLIPQNIPKPKGITFKLEISSISKLMKFSQHESLESENLTNVENSSNLYNLETYEKSTLNNDYFTFEELKSKLEIPNNRDECEVELPVEKSETLDVLDLQFPILIELLKSEEIKNLVTEKIYEYENLTIENVRKENLKSITGVCELITTSVIKAEEEIMEVTKK